MHAKRMFNQRAGRKPEIIEKRKTTNVVNVLCFSTRTCVCKAEGVLPINQNYTVVSYRSKGMTCVTLFL